MIMINKIDHINIVVSDLERTTKFFTDLGFSVEDRSELSGEWFSAIARLEDVHAEYVKLALPKSETRLELIQFTSPPSKHDPLMERANQLGFRHIAFEVSDIEETVKQLQKLGVELLSPIQTYPKTGKRLVYFHGPDNNLLELAQYG